MAKLIRLSSKKRSEKASKLFDLLKERVKGQDPVISNFVKYIESWNSGLRRGNSPIYKGLFLGLPNVGKKLFVESLAEILLGHKRYYAEIPCESITPENVDHVPSLLSRMSCGDLHLLMKDDEYRQMFNVRGQLQEKLNKVQEELFQLCCAVSDESADPEELRIELIKATRCAKSLVKAVNESGERLNAYRPKGVLSIIVFSNLERCCPAMFGIIKRVMRDGYVRFESGEVVDLTNSIIIVTSTFISDVIMEELEKSTDSNCGKKMGFSVPAPIEMEKMDKAVYDRLATKGMYKSSLRLAEENLSLDFLSSFDRISIFRPLFKDALSEIFNLELNKFHAELAGASFPILLKISDDVKNFIVSESLDHPEFGAARLVAKFDKYIRREVARLKNLEELAVGDVVQVSLENKEIIFSREHRSKKDR